MPGKHSTIFFFRNWIAGFGSFQVSLKLTASCGLQVVVLFPQCCLGIPPELIYIVGGFSPTHLKNMRKSNWIISPGFGMNIRNIGVATTWAYFHRIAGFQKCQGIGFFAKKTFKKTLARWGFLKPGHVTFSHLWWCHDWNQKIVRRD